MADPAVRNRRLGHRRRVRGAGTRSPLGGDLDAVATWTAKAYQALAPVADAEDREVIEADLATLP
jgi:hypothetical protein